MADNNVLFATLLALIARLILHVLKSIFLFSPQQLAIPKEDLSHLDCGIFQFQTKVASKRLLSVPRQRRFWVLPARTSTWWENVRAGLAVVLGTALKTLKNAPKSHRRRGLRMPKPIVEFRHPTDKQFRLLQSLRNYRICCLSSVKW